MSLRSKIVGVFVVVGGFSLGCSSDDGGDSNQPYPTGRGSAACQAWHEAICDLVGECSSRTRAECIENYFGVTCRDDAQAEQCATNLAAATCSSAATAVVGCDLSDVADPAPAVAACTAYVNAFCTHNANCGAGTLETCLAQAATEVDCSQAMAYTLDYDTCMSELASAACTATELPASCQDVIKVSQ